MVGDGFYRFRLEVTVVDGEVVVDYGTGLKSAGLSGGRQSNHLELTPPDLVAVARIEMNCDEVNVGKNRANDEKLRTSMGTRSLGINPLDETARMTSYACVEGNSREWGINDRTE